MSRVRAPHVPHHGARRRPSPFGRGRRAPLAALAGLFFLVLVGTGRFGIAEAVAAEFASAPNTLDFLERGRPARTLALSALVAACGERTIEVDDPYHGRRMRYRALPLRCVLEQGFAARGGAGSIEGENLLLRARDGYTRSASGAELLDPNAHLAFGEPGLEGPGADAAGQAAPRFRPIDRRQVDPAPFYLVWTGVAHGDPHEHPWPYQLVTIEIAPFEAAFPHTVPEGLAKSDPVLERDGRTASCRRAAGVADRARQIRSVPRKPRAA